ncbi:MAG: Gfo/Idh/MocA family oxidoreductase, partial [Candidatus Latescibacterota bacterium]
MTLRIGIVGAGANTRSRHIPGFRAIDGVEVTAVANRTLESGRKAAAELGIPHVFGDWQELVHSDHVDAVCVGTWPYLHCPVTLETLKAGKHILTEARMAMDHAEARRMHEAAQRSDRVAMVVPAPYYLEYEPVLLEMVAQGFFGDWLEIHVRGMGGAYDPSAPVHWRQRRALSGHNAMALGIINETLRRYAGDEAWVLAHGTVFTPQRRDPESGRTVAADVPESLGVVAQMHSGATAVYHLSSVTRLGTSGAFELHGTKGALKLQEDGAWIAGEGDRHFRKLEVPAERQGGWRVERDFADAIREGRPVTRTSFGDGVRYMAFTEAVQISLR